MLRLLSDRVAIREPAQRTSPDLFRVHCASCCAATDLPRHKPFGYSLRILTIPDAGFLVGVRTQQELFAGRPSLVDITDGIQCALCRICSHDGHGDEALGYCASCQLALECKLSCPCTEYSRAETLQIRLTYNYARKGGYNIGSEDYRWEILREKIPPPLFFVFNVLFISLAQSVLLWSITTPTYILLLTSRIASAKPGVDGVPVWGPSDLVASGAMVAMVLISAVADQQQWNYQSAKKEYQQTAKVPTKFEQTDLDRGFLTKGLWAYSRHPNFAAEQTFWVALYQWSCLVTGSLWNWTAIGAVGYLILFQASTWFTELVTAKKYPDYKLYQTTVGKFYPKRLTPFTQLSSETQGKTKTLNADGQAKATIPTEEQKRYHLRH